MTYLIRRNHKGFALALALSVVLHALVLCIPLGEPLTGSRRTSNRQYARLDARLSRPHAKVKSVPSREHGASTRSAHPTLSVPAPAKTWTLAERNEMDQFLNELGTQTRPPGGNELAQRALAMARNMPAPEEDDDLKEMTQRLRNAHVEPYTLDMYFDALFRKMNRSAAMVPNEGHAKGRHVAAVRIVLGPDGSVKNFRILWAADQQGEIDYIKAVVDQAAPFPIFPSDIRNATDSIVLQVCILPGRYADGGATFSRMSRGQGCREPDA